MTWTGIACRPAVTARVGWQTDGDSRTMLKHTSFFTLVS